MRKKESSRSRDHQEIRRGASGSCQDLSDGLQMGQVRLCDPGSAHWGPSCFTSSHLSFTTGATIWHFIPHSSFPCCPSLFIFVLLICFVFWSEKFLLFLPQHLQHPSCLFLLCVVMLFSHLQLYNLQPKMILTFKKLFRIKMMHRCTSHSQNNSFFPNISFQSIWWTFLYFFFFFKPD